MTDNTLTLAELRKKYSAPQRTLAAPKSRVLWVAHEFIRHLEKELAVICAGSATPYQSMLAHINGLSPSDKAKLIESFLSEPTGLLYSQLLSQPSLYPVSRDISKVHPELRAAMLQLALGENNHIVTFTQQFSDKFLRNAAKRASIADPGAGKRSLGEIMHVKFRNSLKDALRSAYGAEHPLPRYWATVEHAIPSRAQLRGSECGFHMHGQIIASKESLPEIKRALYRVAECYDNPSGKRKRKGGYRQRGDNLAVHFGEPNCMASNRGGRNKCLSSDPSAEWSAPKDYDFHWARYSAQDSQFTIYEAQRQNVRLGATIFWQSPGLNKEAEACLDLYRHLVTRTQH